ncbi:MAG: class I SAM-dependent methyltransferase [Deltaproteobacteria bacterium]
MLYFGLRPFISLKYSQYLSSETQQKFQPHLCLGPRGLPLESRRRWGSKYLNNLHQATVLVQGTGTGWDILSWAKLKPRKIIATDLFAFEDSWQAITKYCYDHYRTAVEFRLASIDAMTFLDNNSVDLIASDAVYEHCRHLPAVMQESYRILKPGGCVYASYGHL